MTLKKTLCRPVQLDSGSWATTDAVGANLAFHQIPELLLNQSIFSKKLDGFQGIRGSITLRLQVTANPFQQGLVKLMFYPLYWEDETYGLRTLQPESWSFWPSVELNLSKETACELRVPFTLPVSFCSLMTNTVELRPQMGAVIVKVYSQLKVGAGSNTVGWNLYGHWNEDDLALVNPTPNVYQSGTTKKLTHGHSLPADQEKKSDSISSSLAAGSTIATYAAGIPVLADIAGPTAWALRVASRVASALGFSRPPLDSKPILTTRMDFPYNGNVEGPDVSMPLSLTTQPSLKFEPKLGGKNEDEMAIDSFVSKFGYYTTINFPTSDIAGAILENYRLGPAWMTANETKYPKPYQLLGKIFKWWRGNIRIRIKFVKTKMHTARLQFSFFPGFYDPADFDNSEYVHREIVDISNVDELIYELPFTSQFPYLSTTVLNSDPNTAYYGSFQIMVINPLTCPSSVASAIDLIMEVAMGEGSEWVQPGVLNPMLPTVPIVMSTASTRMARPKPKNTPQSGESPPLVRVSTLSEAKITGHQTETAQLCIGEKILSLRQLIKYPADITYGPSINVTSDSVGTINKCYFQPFAIGAVEPLGTKAARFNDLLNLIAPYFRFSRGGMRVRGNSWCPGDASYPTGILTFVAKSSANPGIAGIDTVSPGLNFGGQIHSAADGIWKFTIPAWQNVPMVPHHYAVSDTVPEVNNLMARQNALAFTGVLFKPSESWLMYMNRQPADDYELISFVGPPLFTQPA